MGALFALCLIFFQTNAQTPVIHNFSAEGGQVTFDATLSSMPNDTSPAKLPLDEFFLGVSHERPIPMEANPNSTGDTLKVTSPIPAGVFPGKRMFAVLYQFDTVFIDIVSVPNPLTGTGQQPIIEDISPRGTSPGRVVTIQGRGFGDNLDDIYIWFTTSIDTALPPDLSHIINPTAPTFLTSPDANGIQQLKFILPGENSVGDDLQVEPTSWLEYELRMRVVVKGQPSANTEILSIVTANYRTILLVFVLAIFAAIVLGIWGISIYLNRRGFKGSIGLRYLVIDQTTNQLSLAKCQALAWTIVLVISYSYYVLMVYMILDKSVIPDFDPSLLILMGITTSGMLVARTQDKNKQTKAEEAGNLNVAANPSLWDLISENGTINLASLQLVAFTIVGIGIYIVYMTSPNLVETGLPTMPDTLLALMGISQGGYITGKSVEGSGASNAETTKATGTEGQAVAQSTAQPATTTTTAQPVTTTAEPVAQTQEPVAETPSTADTNPEIPQDSEPESPDKDEPAVG